jgi:hypothetical protein
MVVCLYFLFVLSCEGTGLAMDQSPIQGVLPTVCELDSETQKMVRPWTMLVYCTIEEGEESLNFV